MTYESAIKHLSNPRVISSVFDQKTRDAIRVVVQHAKRKEVSGKKENKMYFVFRNGAIIAAFEEEEEAAAYVENDMEDSRRQISEDYDLDEETADEEIEYMVGREMGYAYYEYVDLDSLEDGASYTTEENDTFSKEEFEEYI